MCGRFVLDVDFAEIIRVFKLDIHPDSYQPLTNIAPSQQAPVVLQQDRKRILRNFRWGLIPSWAKEQAIGSKMFNARGESIAEKPSFKRPFLYQRCLVPASGFYEWKKLGKEKVPYYFTAADHNLIAFAGIWDRWLSPTNEEVFSFSIITTAANAQMQEYHERMPAILARREEQEQWLGQESALTLQGLLKPYEGQLKIAKVTKL